MPWRGPQIPGEFPTLGYLVADWIEDNCVIPDGEHAGEPFLLPEDQLRFILWHYRLRTSAKVGKPAQAFLYRRSQLDRPQKWGKGPLAAAIICAEAAADGPVLFDGWDANGEPVGRPWPTPWVQVVAVAEDQTDNIWTALVPMIELGSLAADIPDTGKTRINVPAAYGSRGLIEPVTSAHLTRLGQRITFAVHDQAESWTAQNGGVKLADTQRRNLAGMGGRSIETNNAWDPAEESVAQATFEALLGDVHIDYPKPIEGSIRNKRERRRALKHAYGNAATPDKDGRGGWVDINRIEAEIVELLPRDPGQAERWFLNRIVAGQDTAFDVEAWKALADERTIEPGRLVTLGFDGSVRLDSTGLVATDVETGHQIVVGAWERPANMREDDWVVPVGDVTATVEFAFEEWNVWRLYGDPPYWETPLDEWAGRWGEDRVVRWWTNRLKAMAFALKAWTGDWREGSLSHDGDERLERHIANAVKHATRMRDEDGSWLWVIRKESPKSTRKIDLAMAACLSWEARGDAIRAGAMNEPEYARAQW